MSSARPTPAGIRRTCARRRPRPHERDEHADADEQPDEPRQQVARAPRRLDRLVERTPATPAVPCASIAAMRSLWFDSTMSRLRRSPRSRRRSDGQRHDDGDDGDEYGNDIFVHGTSGLVAGYMRQPGPGLHSHVQPFGPSRRIKGHGRRIDQHLAAGRHDRAFELVVPAYKDRCSASPTRSSRNGRPPRTPRRRRSCASGRPCPASTAGRRSAPGSTPSRVTPA